MMFRCLLVVWRLLNFAHDLHYTIWTLGTTLFTGWLDHPSDLLKSVSSRVPGWFTTALDPHQRPKKPTRYTMSLWNFFTNLTTEIRIRMESWKNHPTVFNSKKRAPFFFWSRENAIRNCGRFHQVKMIQKSLPIFGPGFVCKRSCCQRRRSKPPFVTCGWPGGCQPEKEAMKTTGVFWTAFSWPQNKRKEQMETTQFSWATKKGYS